MKAITAAILLAQPAHAEAEAEVLPRLIAMTCADMLPETGCERFVLLESSDSGDTADLIVLFDHVSDRGDEVLITARNIAFNGSLWGMAPRLEATSRGTILLHSEQSGIGRHPWFETLTLAYRNEDIVVAGYTFSSYDRITNDYHTCDINLLTGDFDVETVLFNVETEVETPHREAGRTEAIHMPLTDWPTRRGEMTVCSALANIYYSQ